MCVFVYETIENSCRSLRKLAPNIGYNNHYSKHQNDQCHRWGFGIWSLRTPCKSMCTHISNTHLPLFEEASLLSLWEFQGSHRTCTWQPKFAFHSVLEQHLIAQITILQHCAWVKRGHFGLRSAMRENISLFVSQSPAAYDWWPTNTLIHRTDEVLRAKQHRQYERTLVYSRNCRVVHLDRRVGCEVRPFCIFIAIFVCTILCCMFVSTSVIWARGGPMSCLDEWGSSQAVVSVLPGAC